MSNRNLIYLAVPYSSPDAEVRLERYEQVTKAASKLILDGHIVYSPITHHHPMAVRSNLPTGWNFWRRLDEAYLKHAHTLMILPLDNWEMSIGLKAEYIMASDMGLDILFLNKETFDIDWNFKTEEDIL